VSDAAAMGRSTRGTPSAPPAPDPGFFGADLDPETAALIKQLQQEDINAAPVATRRERKAPEVYKPPPPGVGGLAKSERPAKKEERRETRGGRDAGKPGEKASASNVGDAKKQDGAGSSRGKAPSASRTSTGGTGADRRSADRKSLDAADDVGAPGVWSEKPLPGYKKPQGKEYERFKHHLNEVWVQSTQRAGGGDHSDHVFKRFDRNGAETPFENAGSKGEYVKGNMQPSLRSKKAVETYLERVAKAAGRKGAKEGDKAKARPERDEKAGAGEKDAKVAAEKSAEKSPDAPAKSSRDDRAAGKAERESAAEARDAKGERGRARETRDRGGREAAEKSARPAPEKPAPARRDGKEKRGRRSGDGATQDLASPRDPDPEPADSARADASRGAAPASKDAKGAEGSRERKEKATASPTSKEEVAPYDAEACRGFASAPAETLERRAAYVLEQVSGHVASIRAQIAAERAAPGPGTDGAERKGRKGTPQMLPGGTYRLVCDRCSGSVADGHRNCAECGSDYCVECCAEMRAPPRSARRSHKSRSAHASPRDAKDAKDTSCGHFVRCPNCLANGTDWHADASRGASSALAFKVRCVSVTTQRSLAVAKAMPDPLADVDGLADRYGGRAFEQRREEARELADWLAEAERGARARLAREVFGEPNPGDAAEDAEARRAPDSEAWRHALDAGDAEAHAAAIERRRAAAAPSCPCERCAPERAPEAERASDGSGARDEKASVASSTTAPTSRAPHSSLPIWSPAASDVDGKLLSAQQYEEVLEHFQAHWRRGEPVIVTGVRGAGDAFWAPEALAAEMRATRARREERSERAAGSRSVSGGKKEKGRPDAVSRGDPRGSSDVELKPETVTLTDCADGSETKMPVEAFFECLSSAAAFDASVRSGRNAGLLKLRDWPGDDDFKARAPRHAEAFFSSLPFQEYTNAEDGPLNLSVALPKEWVPPDLGPKTYVAMGRLSERGLGDSVTKLHQDASDAVNVLLHVGPATLDADEEEARESEASSVGAVWDVFRREDVPVLTEWLRRAWDKGSLQFQRQRVERDSGKDSGKDGVSDSKDGGKDSSITTIRDRQNHPIHDQSAYLTAADLATLLRETGVAPWSFEQRLGDAVFVPAGCPHQVRNLRACVKVAEDFVSPESAGECLALAKQLRTGGFEDKLQGRAMVMHAARVADAALNGFKQRAFGPASAAAIAAHEAERAAAAAAAAAGASAGNVPEQEEWAKEWDEHATADVLAEEDGGDGPARAKKAKGKRVKAEPSAKAAAADARRAAAKASRAADAAEAGLADEDPASADDAAEDEEHDEMALLLMGLGDAPPKAGKRKKEKAAVKAELAPAKKQKPEAPPPPEHARAAAGPFAGVDFAALQQQQQIMLQAMQAQGGLFAGFNPAMAAAAAAYGGGFPAAPSPAAPPPPPPPPAVPNFGAPGAPSFFGGGLNPHAGVPPGGAPGFGMGAPPVPGPANPVAFPPAPPQPSATEQARAMLILLTQNPGVALSVIQTQPHLLAVPEVKTVYDAYVANVSKPPQAQAPEQAP
jgi:lysine-specific demethylase 3